MPYKANTNRYQKLIYRRCGNSGLLLPPKLCQSPSVIGGNSKPLLPHLL